jgi:hypothetical protein
MVELAGVAVKHTRLAIEHLRERNNNLGRQGARTLKYANDGAAQLHNFTAKYDRRMRESHNGLEV